MCQLYMTDIFLKLQITRGVRKILQTQCILDNQGIYMYKTNTKLLYIVYKYTQNPQTSSSAISIAFRCTHRHCMKQS